MVCKLCAFFDREQRESYIQSCASAIAYVTSVAVRVGIKVVSRKMLVINVLDTILLDYHDGNRDQPA